MSFRKVKISDFCLVTDYVANGSFKSLKNNVEYLYDDGYAILVRLTDFTKNWNNNYRYVSKKSYDFLKHSKLHPGDLIMSNVGEPGRVFLLPDLGKPMTLGPNSILIRPDKTKASSFYMKYYFESQFGQNQILQITSGAAQKKFNKTSFRSLLINLPSLSIQQKIVAKLDAIFAEIDKATASVEANAKNGEVFFESYLKQIFGREGECWEMVKLGDVLKTSAGGTPLKSIKKYYEGGDIPWLMSGEVCLKDINTSLRKITKLGLDNSSAKLFPTNTTLIAMYGATAGQVGILRFPATTNQAVCGIMPNKNYLPEFLYYYLSFYKKTLLLEVSGVAQPNLSQIKIKNISIPKISVAIQQKILVKLDEISTQVNKLNQLWKNKINELTFLKQSILKQAFNGELVKAA